MARNCGAKPWSDATNVVELVVAHVLLREAHRLVGARVGLLDEALALADAVVAHAVEVHVVVGRVVVAVGELARDEPEELVLHLVGHGVAHHRQVGLVGVEHVLDERLVERLPVLALLDVGLLAHDPGLEHGEVAGLRGGPALVHPVLERAGEARRARPRRPARVRARHRGVEQADLERSPASRSTLTRKQPVLPLSGSVGDVSIVTLTSAHSPSLEVADLVGAALGAAEEHAVIARLAVVAAVVEVRVEAVRGLVDVPSSTRSRISLAGCRSAARRSSRWRPSARRSAKGARPAKPSGWSNCRPKAAANCAESDGAM